MRRTNVFKSFTAVTLLLTGTNIFAQTANNTAINADPKSAGLFAKGPDAYKTEEAYNVLWPRIDEKDMLWRKRVWRKFNINEPGNTAFSVKSTGTPLAALLANGLVNGTYKGYSAEDDRFTQQLTPQAINDLLHPAAGKKARFDPAKITSFGLKEDWIYLANEHKLVVRIIGIAPLIPVKDAKGNISDQPVFWLYYPSVRHMLANAKISGAASASDGNLDMVFEQRHFASRIYKFSIMAPNLNPGRP